VGHYNRSWFDEECKTAVDERNAAYKKMDRLTDYIQKTRKQETPENSL